MIALDMGKGVGGEGVVARRVKDGREELPLLDLMLESIMPGIIQIYIEGKNCRTKELVSRKHNDRVVGEGLEQLGEE